MKITMMLTQIKIRRSTKTRLLGNQELIAYTKAWLSSKPSMRTEKISLTKRSKKTTKLRKMRLMPP